MKLKLRITGGENRGRGLEVAPGTRPSTDRLKESVFSALESRGLISGARVLDLFAGSGALGFEALSRGASSVQFVEEAREAVSCIRNNGEALGVSSWSSSQYSAVDFIAQAREAYSLIFADPPYVLGNIPEIIRALLARGLLEYEGALVLETSSEIQPLEQTGLEIIKEAKVGSSRYIIYQRIKP